MFRKTLLLTLFLSACTSPDKARETLEDEGYSHIQIGGWSPYGCAHGEGGDSTCTKFEAKGPSGRYVRGVGGLWLLAQGLHGEDYAMKNLAGNSKHGNS